MTFYYNVYGNPAWNPLPITGPGGAAGTPAVIQRADGETDVVAVAPNGAMTFYYNTLGNPAWNPIPITDPGGAAGSPAIVQRPNKETDVVAVAPNGAMTFYYNVYGNPAWNPLPITGPGGAAGTPAVIQRADGETDVVAVAPNGAMTFYYNTLGNPAWNPIPITGPGGAAGSPAIVQRPDKETDVVAVAPNGAMTFYYNVYGNPAWNPLPITGPGGAAGTPAVIQRADGETDVVAVAPNGAMTFYYNTLGNPAWESIPITGPGGAAGSPAIVQQPDGDRRCGRRSERRDDVLLQRVRQPSVESAPDHRSVMAARRPPALQGLPLAAARRLYRCHYEHVADIAALGAERSRLRQWLLEAGRSTARSASPGLQHLPDSSNAVARGCNRAGRAGSWRVTLAILRSSTPAAAAAVAYPARSEWPESISGGRPAAMARRLTISATDWSESRRSVSLSPRRSCPEHGAAVDAGGVEVAAQHPDSAAHAAVRRSRPSPQRLPAPGRPWSAGP